MTDDTTNLTADAQANKRLDPQLAQALFHNAWEQYIKPELERRAKTGSPSREPLIIRKFLIGFETDGTFKVEINEDANIGVALADPDLISDTLEPGALLGDADLARFAEVMRIEPLDTQYANSGFICAAHIGNGEWVIGFDARYNVTHAGRVATTASDFLETARDAEQKRRFGPLVDNLYAAYELAAKALLWTHPRGFEFTDKMKKGDIQTAFFQAAEDGLFPEPWATAFRELWQYRNPSRYAYEGAQTNWKAVPRWLQHAADIVERAEASGRDGRLIPTAVDTTPAGATLQQS